ncbi:MAG: hypothetical protein ACFFG0_17970 [Candidatus Thorarchaeota archaeon]
MNITANVDKNSVSYIIENESIEFGDELWENYNYWFNATVYDFGNETVNYYNVTLQTQLSGFSVIFNKTANFTSFFGSGLKINITVNYTFVIKGIWGYRFKILSDRGIHYSNWIFFEVIKRPPQNPNNFFRIEILDILDTKLLDEQGFSRVKIEGYLEASDYVKYIVRLNWINLSYTWDYDELNTDKYWLTIYPHEIQVQNDGYFISFETVEVYGNSHFTINGIWNRKEHLVDGQNDPRRNNRPYVFGQLMPYGYDLRQYPALNNPAQEYQINFSIWRENNFTGIKYHLFNATKNNFKSTRYSVEIANFPFWIFHNSRITIYTQTKLFGSEPSIILIDLSEKQETFFVHWLEFNIIALSYTEDTTTPGKFFIYNPLGNIIFQFDTNIIGIQWYSNYSRELVELFPEPSQALTSNYEIRKEVRIFSRGEEIDSSQFQIELELIQNITSSSPEYHFSSHKINLTDNFFYSYPLIWNVTLNPPYYIVQPFRIVSSWNRSKINIYYDDDLIESVRFNYDSNEPYIDIILPPYYNPKEVYFGLYNYDGLGLESELFKFYINGSRADFGFNLIRGSYAKLLVTDYFDIIMYSETIPITLDTDEHDIQVTVFKLIINNNFSFVLELHIERTGLDQEIVQTIPQISGIEIRLVPNVTYILTAYNINGTKLGEKEIFLNEDNEIVSFGFFEVTVPLDPTPLFNSLLSLVFFILYFVGFIGLMIILYLRFRNKSVERRRDDVYDIYGKKMKSKRNINKSKRSNKSRKKQSKGMSYNFE